MTTKILIFISTILFSTCHSSGNETSEKQDSKTVTIVDDTGTSKNETGSSSNQTSDSGDSSKQNTSKIQNAMSDDAPATKTEIFPLIVEFYSIGEGVKSENRRTMDKFIAEEEKQFNAKISFLSVPWGREGEVDFCFRLSQLKTDQRKIFINGLKSIFDEKSLVHILENQPCRYVR